MNFGIGFAIGLAMGPRVKDVIPFLNLVGLVIVWLYNAGLQTSKLQGTLGMLACGLKVTDLSGAPVSFGRATGRFFSSLLSGLIIGIGYLMIIWSPRKQALHDQISGTLVLVK